MKPNGIWQKIRPIAIVLIVLILLSLVGWTTMGQKPFIRTTLSGLTLGALFFMVAAGLTLIFGLMDVLNFAHGAMFMIGAYGGWQFYTNPTFIFGLLPILLAPLTGLAFGAILRPAIMKWHIHERVYDVLRALLYIIALVLLIFGLLGYDIIGLADTAMVATMVASDPLAEATAQEALAQFWLRPLLLGLAGLITSAAGSLQRVKTTHVQPTEAWKAWTLALALLAATILMSLVRESGPIAVLSMNANLRFLLSLITGFLVGAGLGAAIEITLIRPLYVRSQFLVLLTLGLAFVMQELAQVLWDPLAYQMSRPPMFSQPGKAENILAWFSGNNVTIDILGVTFPSYRLFILVLGVVMLIALAIIMNYTRLGMIIRAGVQDREMVEALGINVRTVFTLVFALGVGLAALGGIGAAPFIPVEPTMGGRFQLQAFITVVLGGMGSYGGAAIGAMLLGFARAFGDYLALKFSLSPAISEASTVIIMAIVLLVRPAGLFGRKE